MLKEGKYEGRVDWDYFIVKGDFIGLVYRFRDNRLYKKDISYFENLNVVKKYLISENIIPKHLPEEEE
jgi:hypothetical protein